MAQVERHAYYVALLPLDDVAARQLLLRQRPRLEPRLVDEAAHLARGNPLYLIHLARESGLRVPVSAQAALTERVVRRSDPRDARRHGGDRDQCD